MKRVCFKFLIILSFGLFLTWQITACASKPGSLPEDARSHGRLDPEAQRRLANPKETAKEHKDEIKKLQNQTNNLESQINAGKL